MAKSDSDQSSGGRRGFAAYLPVILSVLIMPAVGYLSIRYLPGLKGLPGMASLGGTNQPAAAKEAKATNELKLLKQKAAPKMPVPVADGQLGFDPDVAKDPGPMRLVLTNAPKMPSFQFTLKLADQKRPRYMLMEIFMVGENTDELIAKANAANRKEPSLFDLVTNRLSGKTADNLLKPGSRNILRTELLALCNQVLGSNTVQEVLILGPLIQ